MNIGPVQVKCGLFPRILGKLIASQLVDISAIEKGVLHGWGRKE
jgi:hypothetical protein